MADKNKWDLLRTLNFPASYGYSIPTGGAKPNVSYERPNKYLRKLGAQRAENPPVNWDDQPYKLAMHPDILNDPAFSEYDPDQLRSFKQDPRLRDEIDLGIIGAESAKEYRKIGKESRFAKSPDLHGSYGFTYIVRDAPIPIGGALKVIAGQKLVLDAQDSMIIHSSSASSVDAIASILQDVS